MKPSSLLGLVAISPAAAIIGGQPVPPGKYPFIVSINRPEIWGLYPQGRDQCTGVLIAKDRVLTAASCLRSNRQIRSLVSLNASQRVADKSKGLTFPAEDFEYPPPWGAKNSLAYNVAVVRFIGDHNITEFARLPARGQIPPVGRNVTVMGFGQVGRNGEKATVLSEISMRVIDADTCANQMEGLMKVEPDKFCGEACPGKEWATCMGDWGGPVMYNQTVMGIMSEGHQCTKPGCYPNVFTAVAHHLPFIEAAMPPYEDTIEIDFDNGKEKKKKKKKIKEEQRKKEKKISKQNEKEEKKMQQKEKQDRIQKELGDTKMPPPELP
jgi:trypsin